MSAVLRQWHSRAKTRVNPKTLSGRVAGRSFFVHLSYNSVTTELELHGVITLDEKKSRANLKKHGVSFESAQLVFEDPLHMSRQDRGGWGVTLANLGHGMRCGAPPGCAYLERN